MTQDHPSPSRWELLGSRFPCACGVTHEVAVQEAILQPGALDVVPEVLRRHGGAGHVFLLADERTYAIAGERVSRLVRGAGRVVHERVLKGKPKALWEVAEGVAAEVSAECGIVISCGSGTITDLGKWAANRHHLPQIAVATAPSMNGYASGIAALARDGLKMTTPVAPARAVIADLETLAAAPMPMIQAGLGDLLSKSVCNADWRLETLLRGGRFCPLPFELLKDLEALYMSRAALLQERDPTTIRALTEALIFSGISMLIAGSSQPASGAEHLISHVLDMKAMQYKRETELHGVQVGIGTIATAKLYERLLAIKGASISREQVAGVWDRSEKLLTRCRDFFGGDADLIVAEYAAKRGEKEHFLREASLLPGRWDDLMEQVRPYPKSAGELTSVLKAAGAKTSFHELGLDAELFRTVCEIAQCVRNRYTCLDLANAVGELEAWADKG